MMDSLETLIQQLNSLNPGSRLIVNWAVATVVLLVLLFVQRFTFSKVKQAITNLGFSAKGFYFKHWEIIPADSVQNTIEHVFSVLGKITAGVFITLYTLYILSFFELTKRFSMGLIELVWSNLQDMMLALLAYMPKLVFIIIMIFITKWVLGLFHSFMLQIEMGRIKIHMFPAEYAAPTRQLLSFAIIVFAMVIVGPYLPGSGSEAFKGVTVFLGILVSLGSTTAIANILASFVIQYMRAFNVGDVVQIGNNTGTIVSINLFSTRMQNISNEYISIPNGLVLTGSLTNYSRKKSTAVEVGISIGYDVPWRRVHEALLAAASQVEGISDDPEPFVLQKSLDDFYVSYRLYAYVELAQSRPHIVSQLNQSIRDYFEQQGIEILSPHHRALAANADVAATVNEG